MRAILPAVLLLSLLSSVSCGGGSSSTPPPKMKQFYLPLAVGNMWTYDCGSGITITDSVTQSITVNNQATFAFQLQFPNGPTQTFLLANDSQGNVTFYGYLVNGTAMPVTPTVYVSANPSTTADYSYAALGGGTVARKFINFESTNPTPLGTFRVASYNDNGTQDIWGYTLAKGITEQDHGTFDCKVTSIHVQ